MTIHYKDGDAFAGLNAGEVNHLIHCCNAQGVMGSGFAKSVKELHPYAFLAYTQSGCQLGSVTANDGIINLVGQEFYGKDKNRRYVSYDALTDGLARIADSFTGPFGIPYLMGCDRAGGEWAVVEKIIATTVAKYNKVVIYRLC